MSEPRNELLAVSMVGSDQGGEILLAQRDFVSAPQLSSDGSSIAFVSWSHPNIPWDNTTLWPANFKQHRSLCDLTKYNLKHTELNRPLYILFSSLIILQCLEEKVVPPNQYEMIFESLKTRGVVTALVSFEGEGHGFRKAENIVHAIQAELYLYYSVLNMPLAYELSELKIDNLTDDKRGKQETPGTTHP